MADESASSPNQIAAALQGRRIPAEVDEFLLGTSRANVLWKRACAVYFYPGSAGVAGAEPWRGEDDAQHRAFQRHRCDLAAYRATTVGISSEPHSRQIGIAVKLDRDHLLFSDRELRLAALLGLPTFSQEGRRYYNRLTLITSQGACIEKVFYPLHAPARSAAQVCTWLRLNWRPS